MGVNFLEKSGIVYAKGANNRGQRTGSGLVFEITQRGNEVSAPEEEWDWKSVIKRFLIIVPMVTIFFGVISGLISGEYLTSVVISAIIGSTLFLIFALDYRWIQPRLAPLPRDRRLVLEILFATAESVLGFILAFWISSLIFGFSIMQASIWISVLIGFVVFLVVRSVRYAMQFYRDLKTKELVEEQLKTLTAQAELKALKAQINPHFLFNTLNAIAALTHTDPRKAEETIEKLAEMFRYALISSDRGQVPLREELSFTNRYLEIEKVRFGGSLVVTKEVDEDLLDVFVPSLILQPLVENAIRHGRSPDGSVQLMIRITSQENELVATIADWGPGMPVDFRKVIGKGVGLGNVDGRLRKMYGEGSAIEVSPNEPHGVMISFRIPLQTEKGGVEDGAGSRKETYSD
jgi:two-component system LytT family sensor kinase